jgi:hypothetical protein
MKPLILVPALLALVGCVTYKDIHKNLVSYRGRPLDAAIAHYGYPTGTREVAGHKLYVWSSTTSQITPTFSTTNTTGQVDGYGYSATSTTTGWGATDYQCEMVMEVDEQNTIIQVNVSGTIGGCERYAS